MLDDPALEARAREISQGLRCLVCRNESIDESHAPLARDLRLLVRERLVAGDTNAETVDFIVARYGEYVLLRPQATGANWLLWGRAGDAAAGLAGRGPVPARPRPQFHTTGPAAQPRGIQTARRNTGRVTRGFAVPAPRVC